MANEFKVKNGLIVSGTITSTGVLTVDTDILTRSKLQISNGRLFELIGTSTALNIYDASAGASRIYITDSGNIGIGTNAPNSWAQLETTGTVAIGGILYIKSSQKIQGLTGFPGSAGNLSINPDGGNVGIGTTAPDEKLQVAGNIKIQNETGLLTDYGPLVGRYNTSQVYVGTGGNYSIVKIGRADGGALNVLSGGDVGIGSTTTSGYKLYVNGSTWINGGTNFTDGVSIFRTQSGAAEVMRIASNSNVGIGINSPQTKLDVFGVDNAPALRLSFPSGNTLNAYTGIVFSGETAKAGILFASNAAGYARGSLIFATSNSNDYTGINLTHEKMRITDSGNVGIGTTSPNYKLDVAGFINIFTGNGLRWGSGDAEIINSGWNLLFKTYNGSVLSEAMRINSAGKVSIGTTDTNSDKSDFTVYTGGNTSIALAGNLFRVGESDINWDIALRQNGVLQTYAQNLYLNTVAGNYPVIIQPNGVSSVSFYQSESYINTYTKINYNWGGGDYGTEAFTIRGTYPSIALRSTTHDSKWLIHHASYLQFYYGGSADTNSWSKVFEITTNGNLYMGWAGGYISDLLDAKQNASTAINTSNIGSQSVNYATSSGSSGYASYTPRVIIEDTRSGQRTPNDYDDYRASWEFTNQIPGLSGSSWWSLMTLQGWHNAYAAWQIIGPSDAGPENWYLRVGNNTTWGTARRIWHDGDFTSTNISNWNTAYGWGNHASQGYATTSYVTTQINNLINGAPGALDTLSELASALGNDSSFATTVTNSIAGKVSKSGDTMTGALTIQNGPTATWDYMTLEHPGPYARINLGNAENGFLIAHEGTTTATFATNGNLTITGTFIETSSIKVKENIETSEGNLEKVVNLRPVTYNKIGSQTTELGLIAEEVAEVYPEFVQYDENGEPVGVHYSRLTAALIGAVKELTNQVQELNKKING